MQRRYFLASALLALAAPAVCASTPKDKKLLMIIAGDQQWEATLFDNETAHAFRALLPQQIAMTRMQDYFHGRFPVRLPSDGVLRDTYEIGEIALRVHDNALCIFVGQNRPGSSSRIRLAGPGIPLGKINGDISGFHKFAGRIPALRLSLK